MKRIFAFCSRIKAHCGNWFIEVLLSVPFLFVPVHLWSLQLWSLNLAFLTHTPPSWIWPLFLYVLFCHTVLQDTIEFLHVFHALTLISDQAWIILARGRLHKCWISQPLTMSAPLLCSLTHNCPPQLFCCLYWPCLCYLFLTRVSLSYFGILVLRVRVWAWETENKYTRWIIHGVVSWSARQTVGTVNWPSGPFSPSHAVVKQTMIAEGSPISRLLLLYNHRQDLSPSIHNSGTSLAAWPVWTISIQEIFNASPIIW